MFDSRAASASERRQAVRGDQTRRAFAWNGQLERTGRMPYNPALPLKIGKRDIIMRRDTPVILDEDLTSFINEQVETGRYSSANDVMRAGLRLLEEHEAKVRALEDALIEGEKSGAPAPFDFDAFKARKRAEFKG